MATFNQQGQSVQHQYNADQINIGAQLETLISEVIRNLEAERTQTQSLRSVRSDLESARQAEIAGNRESALQLLRRAAEKAAPAATIAATIATVIQTVTGMNG